MNPDLAYQLLSTVIAFIPVAVFVATLISAANEEAKTFDNDFR